VHDGGGVGDREVGEVEAIDGEAFARREMTDCLTRWFSGCAFASSSVSALSAFNWSCWLPRLTNERTSNVAETALDIADVCSVDADILRQSLLG